AVGGTTAWIVLSSSTVKLKDATAPNATFVAPVNDAPSISMVAPRTPTPGANPITFGVTLKTATLVPVPSGVTTWTSPDDAPVGTTAFKLVAVTLVGAASIPLNRTVVAPNSAE